MSNATNLRTLRTVHFLVVISALWLSAQGSPIHAGGKLPGIGAAGDSLTDEYSQRGANYGDASALCWVDLLARLRGPTSTTPQLTFGDYQTTSMGSPRSRGYTYNWALAGANTATLLSQGQHTGVAYQVRQDLVQYVALFIGSNDFYPAYQALYSQTTPIAGPDGTQHASVAGYVDGIIARYTTALDTVSDAGAKVVMATIVDHGSLPTWAKDFPDLVRRQHVTDAVVAVNNKLKALAVERGLPIVDAFELLNLFYVSSTPSYVGGVSIIKGVAPQPDGRYAVLPDGFHPGTVWQGLLANTFVEACNRAYAMNFTPLGDREILTAAGLAQLAAADNTFFDIKPFVILPALVKYGGGSGTAQDPYRIATAADLIVLGETLEDYDKHFLLTADIDLDPNLPGRKVFDKAVVAPFADGTEFYWANAVPFVGVFDGGGHSISHLRITGTDYLGLFGLLASGAEVRALGVVDVNIVSSARYGGSYIGGLVGWNESGDVTHCYSTGTVSSAGGLVGGLVGSNAHWLVSGGGTLTECYSTGAVTGGSQVGGLVGQNKGTVTQCYSTGPVNGDYSVGGLVGWSQSGSVAHCYSTGAVRGTGSIGGLVGNNDGTVTKSYSAGAVSGTGTGVGGLVGYNWWLCPVTQCFWDILTSAQTKSAGGTGKTTAEMKTAKTYLDAGWDFVGETANGTEDIWWILEGKDYPRLWWQAAKE